MPLFHHSKRAAITSYLSKFRCRSNYMSVSKLYKHEDTYDTKCKLCDKNEIGDEFHY